MNAIHHPHSNTGITTAKLLINGEFIDSTTSHWQDIVNPATQEVLGQVPFATAEEMPPLPQPNRLLPAGVKHLFRPVCGLC